MKINVTKTPANPQMAAIIKVHLSPKFFELD